MKPCNRVVQMALVLFVCSFDILLITRKQKSLYGFLWFHIFI